MSVSSALGKGLVVSAVLRKGDETMEVTTMLPDQLVIFCQEIDGTYVGFLTCPVEYPYGSDGRHGRVVINGHVGVVYQKYPLVDQQVAFDWVFSHWL